MDPQVYLTKARNSLRTARNAYEQRDFDSCASRAYFAVLQAEIAALIKLTEFRVRMAEECLRKATEMVTAIAGVLGEQ